MSEVESGAHGEGKAGERLLLLMPDSPLRDAVQSCLQDSGYAVSPAANARAAAAVCEQQDADLVLATLAAEAGESGVSEIERLQACSGWRPLVLIVDRSRPEAVEQAVVHGALAVVMIDAVPEQLLAAVEIALARGLELGSLRERSARLASALEDRRELALALGICMARHGVSRDDAFKMLCAQARHSGRSVELAAKDLLEAWERGLLPRRSPRRRRR